MAIVSPWVWMRAMNVATKLPAYCTKLNSYIVPTFIGISGIGYKVLPPSGAIRFDFNSSTNFIGNSSGPKRLLCTQSSTKAYAMKRLQGKVAVVTASTDGIGFAIAKRLAEEGASVVVSSRKDKNVANAVQQLQKQNLDVMGVKCHVGDANDRKNLFNETIRKYGKINILVSNAGVNPTVGGVLACDEAIWDKIFDVNVKAAFLLAKEALPHLRQQKNSSIVFVSSIAGYDAFDLLGAYSVSKTALIGLTKAAAKELAPQGIRVNCLAPGIIRTKFSSALTDTDSAKEALLSKIPMQRIGTTEEMSGVVAFLVSDDASYITGESIVAAGGMTARL